MSMDRTLDQHFDFSITRLRVCFRLITLGLLPVDSPFFKAFTQAHHSSRTDGADSIRSIPYHSLAMPMSQHNGSEKHHQQ
jgi:hypothetical protein